MRLLSKKVMLGALSAILLVCLTVLLIMGGTLNAQAAIIDEYPQGAALGINVSYSNSVLTIETEGGGVGLEYQFWIKTKIPVDTYTFTDEDETEIILGNEQYIWQLARNFSTVSFTTIPVTIYNIDENGRYSVITRIKEDNIITQEIYSTYSPQQLGVPRIDSVKFEGREIKDTVIANQGQPLNVKINTQSEGVEFKIFSGKKLISSNFTGDFQLNLNGFKEGEHKLTAEIVVGMESDRTDFTLYVYSSYEASERPVITSLKGDSTDENGDLTGETIFVMKVKYADGYPILENDKNKFYFRLETNGQKVEDSNRIVNAVDGTLDVIFDVTYANFGIYRTQAFVSRMGISSYDDTVILYYTDYSRDAYLLQTSEAQLIGGVYNSVAEIAIKITAELGSIDDVLEKDLRYAFFREDASGWVMIRDYSSSESFSWTPNRPGKYNILARIKAFGSATYEAESLRVYNITKTGSGLLGNLSLNILDYQTKDPCDNLIAGRPYILSANYALHIDENVNVKVLYMFTLTSKGLGTVYLNKYSPSNLFIFIPNKADDYILNVRVINTNSFGYMDIYKPLSVSSDVTTDLRGMGYNIYFDNSTVGDYYSWDISGLSATINSDIESVILKGNTDIILSFTANAGILTVPKSNLAGVAQGNYTLQINCENNKSYRVEAHLAYMVISTADDLTTFMNLMLNALGDTNANYFTDELFIISSDIDYQNQTYSRMPPAKRFRGIFDGNGYAIKNIVYSYQMFGYLTGTVKNLSLLNATTTAPNGNYFIANETTSPARIENLFVQGVVNGTGANVAGLINTTQETNTVISNCILIVEFPNVPDGQITGSISTNLKTGSTIQNTFTISARADSISRIMDGTIINSENYATLAEFLAANNDLSSFTGFWDTSLGIPLPKNYLESLNNIEITNAVTYSAPDNSMQVTSNSLVSYSLLEPYVGVSISADGMITISPDAEAGEFVVVATSIFSSSKTATKQFSIKNITHTDLSGMDYNIYFDKSLQGDFYSWDISRFLARADDEIESIVFKGSSDIMLPFSVDLGILTVAKSNLTGVLQGNYSLLITTGYGNTFVVEAHLAYMVISNDVDLTTYMNLMYNAPITGNNFTDELFIISSDIDYQSQTYLRMPPAKRFRGIFDGNGYTIENLVFATQMYGYLTGTVRNLSFVNVISNGGTVITNEAASPARIQNIYVQGVVAGNTANVAGLINSTVASNVIISNCIVILEFPNVPAGQITGSISTNLKSGSGIQNCFTISARADGLSRIVGGTITNSANYATLEAFLAANRDLSSFTGFWNTSTGIPLLRSYFESINNS